MGKAKKSRFNEVSGRVGNVVFYQMNGKTYARVRPSKRTKAAVGEEKKNQQGFAQVMRYIKPCLSIIKTGFFHTSVSKSEYHTALSANLLNYKEARKPSTPEWLLLSQGARAGALGLSLEKTGQEMVLIQWGDPENHKPFDTNDLAIVVVFNDNAADIRPVVEQTIRNQNLLQIKCPPGKAGDMIYVYVFFQVNSGFVTPKNKAMVSTSQWAGSLTL